jgi:predicted acyl esterase
VFGEGALPGLWATSNVFPAGHRLRFEVSSSNFPRFNSQEPQDERLKLRWASVKFSTRTIRGVD